MKNATSTTRRRPSRARSRQNVNQPLSGIAANTGMGGETVPAAGVDTTRASTGAPTTRNTRAATRSRSARRRASVAAVNRPQGASYGVAFAGLAKQCASLMQTGISKQEISKFIGAL